MKKIRNDDINEITIMYENIPDIREQLGNYVDISRSSHVINMGNHILIGEPHFKINEIRALPNMESDFSQYGFRITKGDGVTEIELGKRYLSPHAQKEEDERIRGREERRKAAKGLEGKF